MADPESSSDAERGTLARKLLPGGSEPDPRFTLANERTFLAWIRTSLALTAGGLGVEAFAGNTMEPWARKGLAVLLLGLGMTLSASSLLRWVMVERAMRHSKPLPIPVMLPILTIGGTVGAAALLTIILTR